MDQKYITIRALDSGEWDILRAMRLHALKTEPGVFLGAYEDEVKNTEERWKDWLSQDRKCVFGLFDGQNLVGITGVFTSRHDPSGQTAVLGTSYILPVYRGQGYSRLLYQARLDWVAMQPQIRRVVVSHRETNESSRRANQAFGFRRTHVETITWPDGTTGDEICYELDAESLHKGLSLTP
jgi:RimJ/RimL family protein N-acetyltransferase